MSVHRNLLFLPDEWLDPVHVAKYRIPLVFVSFAYVEGMLYRRFRKKSYFLTPSTRKVARSIVYGGLFHITDDIHYFRVLDGYYQCSLSTLHRNHIRDMNHRIEVTATPIHFDTLEEMGRCLYDESPSIRCFSYVGNPNHARISQRLNKLEHRLFQGVDKANFIKRYREEKHDSRES